jgi:hypothetical protein
VEFVNQVPQEALIFFLVSLRCQVYQALVLVLVDSLADRNIAGRCGLAGRRACRVNRRVADHVAVLDDRDFVSTLLVFLAANYLVVASAMAAYQIFHQFLDYAIRRHWPTAAPAAGVL